MQEACAKFGRHKLAACHHASAAAIGRLASQRNASGDFAQLVELSNKPSADGNRQLGGEFAVMIFNCSKHGCARMRMRRIKELFQPIGHATHGRVDDQHASVCGATLRHDVGDVAPVGE